MWKKEMDPFMRAKIECFAANQLVLILDGIVLMMTDKLYSKILLIFVMLFMACSNVYVYYREVKRNETLEELEDDK
jgi:hypothetical protein